mmetsp:Transcript_67503/g.156698  ORF Transcript_67503/g.156698 Transcript_67503/m.156698 type:complete len:185 (-) Transcript_67503:143-697(-)
MPQRPLFTPADARSPPSNTDKRHIIWGGVEASSSCSSVTGSDYILQKHSAPEILVYQSSSSSQSSASSPGPRNLRLDQVHPSTNDLRVGGGAGDGERGASSSNAVSDKAPAESKREPEYSVGADQHEAGQCKPCAWHWKPSGCSKGSSCTFCHMCQEGALKARRRERINQLKQSRRLHKVIESL